MKKIFLFILLFVQVFALTFSRGIPQPKNNQLYTEYTCYRSALYLKNPLVSYGYIAMDGQDKFIFKQTSPVLIEIKKNKDLITYKRGDSEPFQVDSLTNGISFIFENPEKIEEKYDVTKNAEGQYIIIPKKKDGVTSIKISAHLDKISRIEILFDDKTNLVYEFKNTVTGKTPDEKYF